PPPSVLYTLSLHDALPICLVDTTDRLRERLLRARGVARGDGGAQLLDLGLHLRQVPAVADPALEALPHGLLRGRVLSHSLFSLRDRKSTRLNSSHVAISYA